MAGVEVTVAIVEPRVVSVIEDRLAILAKVIQRVGPGISELGSQSMPRPEFQDGLKGVVVGCADSIELENVAEIGERKSGHWYWRAVTVERQAGAGDRNSVDNGLFGL